ncbi:hypothetical protein DSL64_06595 [Dyadobacter luteus]|uniref:Secretion system C-terminal sorting domain-containing protein n=1 Tax=Dyadobacter luteus TaxID=2259619 RepID=A0A3D8YF71_9BACT|nr:T9SS type A sorting domain-containing protein [Dyadobacter luteus]REA63279.1 hypothetical protein DSL64_06595 [Dyadobacter luteus]
MKKLLAIFQVVLCAGLSTYTFGQALPVLPAPNHSSVHSAVINGKVTVNGTSQTPAGIIAILSRVDGGTSVPVSYALSDNTGNFSLFGHVGNTYQVSYVYPTAGFSALSGSPSTSIVAAAGNNSISDLVLVAGDKTITNCGVSTNNMTDWQGTVLVDKARPTNNAALQSVSVFHSAAVENPTIKITATSTGATYSKLDLGALVSIEGPAGKTYAGLESYKLFAGNRQAERISLTPDQVLTYYDISSAKSEVLTVSEFSEFIGAGQVSFDVMAEAATAITSTSGNSAFEVSTYAKAGVCLTYTYEVNPLPVTLTSFVAKATSEGKLSTVDVKWSTTAETNSEKFEVEKSADAKNWQLAGTKAAAQNSDVLNNYSFTDLSPLGGKSYYRLKMVDLDGSFAYSKIVGVQLEGSNIQMNLFPNPVAQQLFVQEEGQQTVKEVTIFNNAGNVVSFNKEVAADKGVDVKSLLTGTYLVRVTVNDGSHYTHRIVIAR